MMVASLKVGVKCKHLINIAPTRSEASFLLEKLGLHQWREPGQKDTTCMSNIAEIVADS